MQTTTSPNAVRDDLERFVHDFYDAFLERDWERLPTMMVGDYQQLDESRGAWFRGNPAEWMAHERAAIESAESYTHRIEEVDARMISDTVGVATYVWYGDMRWDGQDFHRRCPSTFVARREADGWKAVLLHSVPVEERTEASA